MAAFNLTAELNLRGPSNLNRVVSNIRRQLSTVSLNLNINPNASRGIQTATSNVQALNSALQNANATATTLNATLRNLGSALTGAAGGTNSLASGLTNISNQTTTVQRNTQQAALSMEDFGRQSALAIRRFAAFSVATGGIYALTRAIGSAYGEFINFNKELVRLQQVTGTTANGLKGITDEITRLSTSLGVTSSDLLTVSSTLAQAGLSATETKTALEALAKSALAPSFDNLNDTVEGSIALMRQFGISANDLESSLGSVNAVAAAFAVESGDIIKAIQRTGGVFAAASKGVTQGKDALNEFISLFTSVRQTTRESAETIATGLRTIFTRIQRGGTIQALKEYGVTLTDLEGKFVGPFEAVRRLSEGLKDLDPRDLRFNQIVEELGGFRQIGKVIPLIQQFATAQQALGVAQKGSGSLAEAAGVAQLSLANKITKVREEFIALIRDIGQSKSFQTFADVSLKLASALISVASSAKEVLPALTALAAIRAIPAIGQFVGGFGRGISRRNKGGPIRAFARGGYVPGSGNRDTVPAMLTPGEFVIRKKAVEKIGVGNLARLNRNNGGPIPTQQFNDGGEVQRFMAGKFVMPKARGKKGAKGYRGPSGFKPLSAEEYKRWAEPIYDQYDRDPSLPWGSYMGIPMPPPIVDYSKRVRDYSLVSGAGLALGRDSKGLEVIAKFGREKAAKQRSRKVNAKTLRSFAKAGSQSVDTDAVNEAINAMTAKEIQKTLGGSMIRAPKDRYLELEKQYQKDPEFRRMMGLDSGVSGNFLKQFEAQSKKKLFTSPKPLIDKIPNAKSRLETFRKELNDELSRLSRLEQTDQVKKEVKSIKDQIRKSTTAIDDIDEYMKGSSPANAGRASHFAWAMRQAIPESSMFAEGGAVRKYMAGSPGGVQALTDEELLKLLKGSGVARTIAGISRPVTADELYGVDPNKRGTKLKKLSRAIGIPVDQLQRAAKVINTEKFENRKLTTQEKSKKSLEKNLKLQQADLNNQILDFGLVGLRYGSSSKSKDYKSVSTFNVKKPKGFKSEKFANVRETASGQLIRVKSATVGEKLGASQAKNLQNILLKSFEKSVEEVAKKMAAKTQTGIDKASSVTKAVENSDFYNIVGTGLESALGLLGAPLFPKTEKTKSIDFPKGLGNAAGIFGAEFANIPTDVTRTIGGEGKGIASYKQQIERWLQTPEGQKRLTKFQASRAYATGGSVQDTVPALLTPGEFVINKKAAKRIGSAKLNKLNKADKIQGFNKGGSVGNIQSFSGGGSVQEFAVGGIVSAMTSLVRSLPQLASAVVNSVNRMRGVPRNVPQGGGWTTAGGRAVPLPGRGRDGGGMGSTALLFIGPMIAESINTALSKQFGKTGAVAGSAISSTISGATVGAAFGPQYAAAGALVGFIAGILDAKSAANEYTKAQNELTIESKSSQLDKSFAKLSQQASITASDLGMLGDNLNSIIDLSLSNQKIIEEEAGGGYMGAVGRYLSQRIGADLIDSFFGTQLVEKGGRLDTNQLTRDILSNAQGASTYVQRTIQSGLQSGFSFDEIRQKSRIGRQDIEGYSGEGGLTKLTEFDRLIALASNKGLEIAKTEAEIASARAAGMDSDYILTLEKTRAMLIRAASDAIKEESNALNKKNVALKSVISQMELFAEASKNLSAIISRASAEFEESSRVRDILTGSGFGEAKIAGPSRLNENVLSNMRAYSQQEVLSTIDTLSKNLGLDEEFTTQAKTSAVAQQSLERDLPRILLEAAQKQASGNFEEGSVRDEIKKVFEPVKELLADEINPEQLSETIQTISERLEKEVSSLQGKSYEEIVGSISEFGQILGPLSKPLYVLQEGAKSFNDVVSNTNNALNQYTSHLSRITELQNQAVSLQLEGANSLKQAMGEYVSVSDLNRPFETSLERLTSTRGPNGLIPGTGTTDPDEIAKRLLVASKELEQLNLQQRPADPKKAEDFANKLTKATETVNRLTAAQQKLANDTTRASNALNRIRELVQVRDARRSGAEDILRNINNPEFMMDFINQVDSFRRVQGGRGTMMDIPGAIESLNRRLQMIDPALREAEIQKTYKAIEEILTRDPRRGGGGADAATVQEFLAAFKAGPNAEMQSAIDNYNAAIEASAKALNNTAGQMESSSQIFYNNVINAAKEFYNMISGMRVGGFGVDGNPAEVAGFAADGGLIYASKGKYVNFQPRGTDTVPAMLSPGEFVVNAKATKNNLGLLKAINGAGKAKGFSKGGISYLQEGGLVDKRAKKLFGELMASSEGNNGYYSELSPEAIFKDLMATRERPLGYSSLASEDAALVDIAINDFINNYEKSRTQAIQSQIEEIKAKRAEAAPALAAMRAKEAQEAVSAGIVTPQDLGLQTNGDNDFTTARALTATERFALRKYNLDKQSEARQEQIRREFAGRFEEIEKTKREMNIAKEADDAARMEINPYTKKPYRDRFDKESTLARLAFDAQQKKLAEEEEIKKSKRASFNGIVLSSPSRIKDELLHTYRNSKYYTQTSDPILREFIENRIPNTFTNEELANYDRATGLGPDTFARFLEARVGEIVLKSNVEYGIRQRKRWDTIAKSQEDFANKNMEIALQQFGEGVDKSPILAAVSAIPKNVANAIRIGVGGAGVVAGGISYGAGKLTGIDALTQFGQELATSGGAQAGMGVEGIRQVGAGLGSRLGFGEAYDTAEQEAMRRREALISQEVSRATGAYQTDDKTTLGNLLTPENVVRGAITTGDIAGEFVGDIGGEKLFGRLFPTAFKGVATSARRSTTPIKTTTSADLFDNTNARFPTGAYSDIATRTTVGRGTNFANMTANLLDQKASVEFGQTLGRGLGILGGGIKKGFFGSVDLAERGLAGLQDFTTKGLIGAASIAGKGVMGAGKGVMGAGSGLLRFEKSPILNSLRKMFGLPKIDWMKKQAAKTARARAATARADATAKAKADAAMKKAAAKTPSNTTPVPKDVSLPTTPTTRDYGRRVFGQKPGEEFIYRGSYGSSLEEGFDLTKMGSTGSVYGAGVYGGFDVSRAGQGRALASQYWRDYLLKFIKENPGMTAREISENFRGGLYKLKLKNPELFVDANAAFKGTREEGIIQGLLKRSGINLDKVPEDGTFLQAYQTITKQKIKELGKLPENIGLSAKELEIMAKAKTSEAFAKEGIPGMVAYENKTRYKKTDGSGVVSIFDPNAFEIADKSKITTKQAEEILKRLKSRAFSNGGMVYASKGTLVPYQPRGTDTVPAMLTPGEFVVNAKATKKNLGLLKAINGGSKGYSKGGVVYLEDGGDVKKPEQKDGNGLFGMRYIGEGMDLLFASSFTDQNLTPEQFEHAAANIDQGLRYIKKQSELSPNTIDNQAVLDFESAITSLIQSSGEQISKMSNTDFDAWRTPYNDAYNKLRASILNIQPPPTYILDDMVSLFDNQTPTTPQQPSGTIPPAYGPALPPLPTSKEELTGIASFVGGGLGQLRLPASEAEVSEADPYAGMNPRQRMLAIRKAEFQASQQAKREAFRAATGRDPKTGRIGGERTPLTDEQKTYNRKRAERMALGAIDPDKRTEDQQQRYEANRQEWLASLSTEQMANRKRAERLALGAIDPQKRTEDQQQRYEANRQEWLEGLSPEQMANRERAERTALNAIRPENRSLEQQERLDILKTAMDQRTPEQIARLEELRRKRQEAIYASKGRLINYQPRGTDTVPAMLTPGEFVVNKKATKRNLGLLKQINSQKFNNGGLVNGVRYFNDGALVPGKSGRSGNGVLSIDAGSLESALSPFDSGVSDFASAIGQFSGIANTIAGAFGGLDNVVSAFTALSAVSSLLSGTSAGLGTAIGLFNTSVGLLSTALSNVPDSINLNVSGSVPVNVTVTVNGGEGLEQNLEGFKDQIYNEISAAISEATNGRLRINLNTSKR